MYLDAVPFYDATPIEMWGDSIRPAMMPLSLLNTEIEKAFAEYRRLHPKPPRKGYVKFMNAAAMVVIAVATVYAVTTAAAGSGAAAASSTTAVGTSSAAASSTAAASASAGSVSASSALSTIKTGASYISKAGALYSKVTGKAVNKDVMAAANFLENSDDATKLSEVALDYHLKQQGIKITDEKTRALLRERLRREQKIQSDRMRRIAAQQIKKRMPRALYGFY